MLLNGWDGKREGKKRRIGGVRPAADAAAADDDYCEVKEVS